MVKIVVDSGSDIVKSEADDLGVIMVPIEVQFGDEVFLDGVNLMPGEFYDKLVSSKDIPTTSLINEYRWTEVFESITKDGDEVVAIVLSSKISGTYNCAKEAASKFGGKVFVVDSLSATLGERVLVQLALKRISEGCSAKEIFEELDERKNKLHVYAMIDTLKYLKKGGRISSTTAFFGELLAIKPLAGVVDGEVKVLGKEKGMKNVFKTMSSFVEKDGGIDVSLPFGALWTGNDKSLLDKFVANCNNLWSEADEEIQQHMMGCTIGTHIGPGAIGIVYFSK